MENKDCLNFDTVIIGAGASGLMCALKSAHPKHKVAVLEHNEKPGKKILISGGGKCNFTNINVGRDDFVSSNKNFFLSAINNYKPSDFLELIKKYKIDYYEKELGQLFCKTSAREILGLLLSECELNGVQVITGVRNIKIKKAGDNFEIEGLHQQYVCKHLVIATGGISFPKLGATSFGYDLAKSFGHSIIETKPALVGLVIPGFSTLSGIAIPSSVKVGKKVIEGNILFTHKGLSGPAILKASLFWEKEQSIKINWLPSLNIVEKFQSKEAIGKVLKALFPQRFCLYLLDKLNIDPQKKSYEISKKNLNKLIDLIHNFQVTPEATTGFSRAEVTKGGVNTKELCPKSMQSKIVDNLFFIGEVVDVTGQLGGFNFQWAWASANASANYLKSKYC